jgi:L-asparaginase
MNLLECEVSVHPFENPVDSSDMGPKEWRMIAEWIHKITTHLMGF